ncbi:MAG TPA: ATP-binding protein, partial [Rhizobiaceae bacterium]|nr:ATP-binding protein [Rhizobiaceae bacterium]
EKLNPEKRFVLCLPEEEVIFAGEREDLEEILGNLLENAVKWGKSTIAINLAREEPARSAVHMFELAIEDDGPGIPEEQAREALKRGKRLDESKPGSGLGLAIVADLVEEYGGTVALERSKLGGLKAVIRLRTG